MDQAEQLALVSANEFQSWATHGFPVGCPTLDVAATWDGGGRSLVIYRPPGQVVCKVHQAGGAAGDTAAAEAVAVTWKPDGQFLAVGWSDGVVQLMGLENNKAAHRVPVCRGSGATITHIGWASCAIADGTASAAAGDGWAPLHDQLPASLPRELAFVEVDTALPKISPLPSGSAGADEEATVFTLRTGIEFLFQPPRRARHDDIDVMVVGTSDGKVQLSIHDSFVVGTFQCPAAGPSATACHMVGHASHPAVSTLALVLADEAARPAELHVLPVDLPFVSSSPINLSLLASKLTTLQKLLRYLKQTQLHMLVEWNNARELPARFLRSVEAGLGETRAGPRAVVAALYHIVVTGHAHGPVREWLVDSLAERGHRRWDKAVVGGLENLRGLVHENLLPALERCAVILSRLRGLAQFHDDGDDVGFSAAQVTRILDVVGCLHLVGHGILAHVMDELDHFASFSGWLRFTIDRLASGAGDELGDKEATMDNSKVLAYIERYLTDSPLAVFLDPASGDDCAAARDRCEDGPSLLPMLDERLRRRDQGPPGTTALSHVDFLVDYMTSWCGRIFSGVAESKKRSVRFGTPVTLSAGRPVGNMDVKVCEAQEGGATIYTALACAGDATKVYIFRAGIDIVNGISANQPATSCCVHLGDRRLVDLKFLNHKNLIVLCTKPDHAPLVVSIPIQSDKLPYAPFSVDRPEATPSFSTQGFAKYRLPVQQATQPVRMEVHDRSDVRGEIPQRICLLSSNRTTWYTFSMPHHDP